MSSSPDVPDPAERPERTVDVEADEVVLGNTDESLGDLQTSGKRALIKPSGGSSGSSASGLNV